MKCFIYLGFVKNYNTYFPEVEYQKYASYVLMNLGEKILATWRKDANKNRTTSTEPKPENKEDTGESRNILQYIGVLQQLCKKINMSSLHVTDKSKEMYNILKAGKSKYVHNQKLVNCKTRGGLWGITDPCLNIFKIAEMIFVENVNIPNFRKFDLDGILEEVCLNEKGNFEVVSEDALVKANDEEIANNVLYAMVKLYLRVRGFSHAKKITETYSTSKKALRKELKRARADCEKWCFYGGKCI